MAIVTSDWGKGHGAGPKRSYVEMLRRHKVLSVLPLVLALLAGAAYLGTIKPTYQATATMWVDVPILAGSSILGPGSPSSTAASVLNEMLQSELFQVAAATQALAKAGPD